MASKSQTTSRGSDPRRSAIGGAKRDSLHPASEQEIRARAYEIFLEHGAGPGHALSDWLQAERELRKKRPPVGPMASGRT